MAKRYVVRQKVATDAPIDEVVDATLEALNPLGGQLVNTHENCYELRDASNGIFGSFSADYLTQLRVKEVRNGYVIDIAINKSPNPWFWVCLCCGIVIAIPWIVNIMYFFSNPVAEYQKALAEVGFELE